MGAAVVGWEMIGNVAPAPLEMLLFSILKKFFLNLFTYVFAVSGLSYGTQDLHCGAQSDWLWHTGSVVAS